MPLASFFAVAHCEPGLLRAVSLIEVNHRDLL